MSEEKRQRLRVPFQTKVRIKDHESDQIYNVNLTDISMNGLFVSGQTNISIGAACDIQIVMKGRSSRLILETHGTVARRDENGFGIHFVADLEWWGLFSIYAKYGEKK